MDFYAIDVETANADYSSICQIGVVEFKNGELVDKWSTLVNPQTYFDFINVSIHGIDELDVKDAPTFVEVYDNLNNMLSGKIAVHHMPFDKTAINQACRKHGLDKIEARWLDSARITRRAWTEFARKGYGLSSITKYLNINFKHHDALEDAIACGKVVIEAIIKENIEIESWFKRVNQPIFDLDGYNATINKEGNPEGDLYGENIVFTGALEVPRKEASTLAANIGCNVSNSVSKKTTLLVVGIQTSASLSEGEKSSKHKKAEELIKKGVPIRILSEQDFIDMCNCTKE